MQKKVNLKKIKKLRKDKGISLEQMSSSLGYDSLHGYYYLETGRVKFPAETLARVASILEVQITDLFFKSKLANLVMV